MDFDLPWSSTKEGPETKWVMALRREKVDGIWNPVGAYDIRNFFFHPTDAGSAL